MPVSHSGKFNEKKKCNVQSTKASTKRKMKRSRNQSNIEARSFKGSINTYMFIDSKNDSTPYLLSIDNSKPNKENVKCFEKFAKYAQMGRISFVIF